MDLPKVPDDLVALALQTVEDKGGVTPNQNTIQERILIRDGKKYLSRANPRYTLEPYFNEWVNDNISEEWGHIGVATSIVFEDSKYNDGRVVFQGPHTDLTRSYALLYVIDQSNTDQYTAFWQDPGKGLHRKKDTIPTELDNLIEIDRVCMPINTWVYFNTTILHSIENVMGKRVAIHVGFDCDPFGVFVRS